MRYSRALARLNQMAGRARKNPRWLVMESLSRFPLVRDLLRKLHRPPALDRYQRCRSRFKGVSSASAVASLHRHGYCTGLKLPQPIIDTILRFTATGICYGDGSPSLGFRYSDKRLAQHTCGRVFSMAPYFLLGNLQPVVDALAHDPLLLEISARYFRHAPIVTGSRLWWVFAAPEAEFDHSLTTSFFHYDKDDYWALRLFFFLTPTDANHGPHVVVRGSHRHKPISQLVSLNGRSDQAIVAAYGQSNLVTVCGGVGDGFIEDPHCFHKANRPVHGDRLMLEIKYATRDYRVFAPPDPALLATILGQPELLRDIG